MTEQPAASNPPLPTISFRRTTGPFVDMCHNCTSPANAINATSPNHIPPCLTLEPVTTNGLGMWASPPSVNMQYPSINGKSFAISVDSRLSWQWSSHRSSNYEVLVTAHVHDAFCFCVGGRGMFTFPPNSNVSESPGIGLTSCHTCTGCEWLSVLFVDPSKQPGFRD